MPTQTSTSCERKHAFTLTELLVALGIIAVLMAILIPVFFQQREAARRSTCVSNLRQIGMAMSQYVSDYDGRYPPTLTGTYVKKEDTGVSQAWEQVGDSLTWGDLLLPYVKTFPRCPTVDCQEKDCTTTGTAGYTMNSNLSEWKPVNATEEVDGGKHETALSAPSLIVLVFDGRPQCAALNFPDELVVNGMTVKIGESKVEGATRHRGGANYLFADNHIKWYRPRQILSGLQGDGKTPGFGL